MDRTTKGIEWNDMDCICVSPLFGFQQQQRTSYYTNLETGRWKSGDPTKPNTKYDIVVCETNGIAQHKNRFVFHRRSPIICACDSRIVEANTIHNTLEIERFAVVCVRVCWNFWLPTEFGREKKDLLPKP